jgi:hypothetical protein
MTDEIEPTADENAEISADAEHGVTEEATWTQSVRDFEAEADWLTAADRPQIKALYSIARELDGGSFQAALISQFTLVHRALLQRRPGGPGGSGGSGGAKTEGQQILDMFEQNPGVWRG